MKKAYLIPGTDKNNKNLWVWMDAKENCLTQDFNTKEEALSNKPQGYTHCDDTGEEVNTFESLQQEITQVINNQISNNEKAVFNLLNTICNGFGSEIRINKNMSIRSFENLICNSISLEEFKKHLYSLDTNKQYAIETLEEYQDSIEFNSDKGDPDYDIMNKFLNSAIRFNDNLMVMEFI